MRETCFTWGLDEATKNCVLLMEAYEFMLWLLVAFILGMLLMRWINSFRKPKES